MIHWFYPLKLSMFALTGAKSRQLCQRFHDATITAKIHSQFALLQAILFLFLISVAFMILKKAVGQSKST